MELLLTKNVPDVGKKGDVVRVRDGFGRNFLLPRNLLFLRRARTRPLKRGSAACKAKEKAAAAEKAKELATLRLRLRSKPVKETSFIVDLSRRSLSGACPGHEFEKHICMRDHLKVLIARGT